MAIDSVNKRRAAARLPFYPVPDGTIDENDRRQAAGFYAPLEVVIVGVTTQPTDFSDLYTMVMNHAKVDTSVAANISKTKRLLNMALQDVAIQQNWAWAEERAVLNTHAPYTTGTVAIALATRTTVTGTSTLWATAVEGMGFDNARAGGKLKFSGVEEPHTVQTVTDDTSIVLTDRYIGTTALTAATYTYYEDEYTLVGDFFRLVDAREFSDEWRLPVLSRQDFYQKYPKNTRIGKPACCTVVDLAPSGSVFSRPTLVLSPAPDKVYQIPYRYISKNLVVTSAGTRATSMANDTDEPLVPLRYRHVLVWYALQHWFRDLKDDARSLEAEAEYTKTLTRMANDSAPERDRARLLPPVRGQRGLGARGSGRYTTDADKWGRFE